jgi:hypothetical protein
MLLFGFVLLFAISGGPVVAASQSEVSLAQIRAQLLYETSGTLSKDLLAEPNFVGWNLVASGDEGREAANDLLVSVVLHSVASEAEINLPLTVTAKTLKGKVLGRRTYRLVVTTKGRVTGFLFLPDATCAGGIVIEAVYGKQRKSAEIDLDCGE